MERRIARRQRVFKAGRLTFAGTTVDCTVRNLSSEGALIELPTSEGVPHELILSLLTHRLNFNCFVVWRDNKRLGVVFGPSVVNRRGVRAPIGHPKCLINFVSTGSMLRSDSQTWCLPTENCASPDMRCTASVRMS